MQPHITAGISINRRLFATLTVLVVFLTSIAITTLDSTAQAPAGERVIDKISWRTEPVKIVQLITKGKPIQFGKTFHEEDDWLTGLTARAENVSNKAIARIQLDLSFPRPAGTADNVPVYTVPLVWGIEPADAPSIENLKLLVPGDAVDVKMRDQELSLIKQDLVTLGYPDEITHARMRIESVTFADGSTWIGETILYPDPANPKRKINPRLQIQTRSKTVPGAADVERAVLSAVRKCELY